MFRRSFLCLSLIGLTSLSIIQSAQAQTPNWNPSGKPIRLIVPYTAGGPVDVTARILADAVKNDLETSIIIENKPGAGGNIGSNMIAKAAPDGLTIGIAAVATHAINPWLFNKMPYDAQKDFEAITQILRVPNILVMNAEKADQLKIKTVKDLIEYARINPGKLNYGSGGNGSAGHLAGELFKNKAHIYAVHIPYNGANPAQLALLSGNVDFNFDNLASAAPNIKSGKLRALALTSSQKSALLPDLPLISETLPNFQIETWWGLVAPAQTPKNIINQLNKAFVNALNLPETKIKFANLMAEPTPNTSEEFKKFMESELKTYQSLVQLSGAKVD